MPPLATQADSKPELLQEFVDSRGADVRIDRSASVLRGVKLLGLTSRNGRRYREQALRRAMPLYEGAKVNVNHPQGDPLSPRDYRDRLGVIRDVRHRPGEGLFGALYFNPKHPLAEQLVWDAEHAPENVGFSHNVLAKTAREGEAIVVEAIDRVQSVDLVADPATTAGLFEQRQPVEPSATPIEWDRLTRHELELHRPDLLVELAEQHQAELAERGKQIEQLTEREAMASRERRILELLSGHGLPFPGAEDSSESQVTSEAFLQLLRSAPDEETLEGLVSDRSQAVYEAGYGQSPVSAREQASVLAHDIPVDDAAGFTAAITKR